MPEEQRMWARKGVEIALYVVRGCCGGYRVFDQLPATIFQVLTVIGYLSKGERLYQALPLLVSFK